MKSRKFWEVESDFAQFGNYLDLHSQFARIAQLVEHDLAKVGVAGSNPVSRSLSNRNPPLGRIFCIGARVVELVDTQDLKSCGHCGRTGSTPVPGTIILLK
jgi:hypothetical protein